MLNGNSRVRHTLLTGKSVPDCLSTLTNTCNAGAQCSAVQSSPAAKMALSVLQGAVSTAQTSLSTRQQLAQALLAAVKALNLDFDAVRLALASYEAAVSTVAVGDGAIINQAGLLSLDGKAPATSLGRVTVVRSKVGRLLTEGIVSWPPGPGATSYAVEANYTPSNPAGPWVDLGTATSRKRVVKGPTPQAQFLLRVASVAADGTRSEWSDAVLVTTR
jgi:hypothetical protein